MRIRNDNFKKSFCWRSYYIISVFVNMYVAFCGLKTVMDFRGQDWRRVWSEIGSEFGEPGGTPPPRIPRNTPLPLVNPFQTNWNITVPEHVPRKKICWKRLEEFQRNLRVVDKVSKNLRKLICLCNKLWKLEEGMAPPSRLDAGRKARFFDMKSPVAHTRNNYFFKGEHRSFFFFIY